MVHANIAMSRLKIDPVQCAAPITQPQLPSSRRIGRNTHARQFRSLRRHRSEGRLLGLGDIHDEEEDIDCKMGGRERRKEHKRKGSRVSAIFVCGLPIRNRKYC